MRPRRPSRQCRTTAGHELTARFFLPDADAVAAVLIVPAMGLTQSYYAPIAAWLAGQGFLVATFDYQGMGRSWRGRLRAQP
jgi:predicted alpha/beta hydrolase